MGKRSKNYQAKLRAAKATPDKIEKTFNLNRGDFQRDLDAWVRDFRNKMLVKHGVADDFDINISVDDTFDYGDETALVHLECVVPVKEKVDASA